MHKGHSCGYRSHFVYRALKEAAIAKKKEEKAKKRSSFFSFGGGKKDKDDDDDEIDNYQEEEEVRSSFFSAFPSICSSLLSPFFLFFRFIPCKLLPRSWNLSAERPSSSFIP